MIESLSPERAALYATAQAVVGCQAFPAGAFLAVRYYCHTDGTAWFLVSPTTDGLATATVAYPEHHLERFVM